MIIKHKILSQMRFGTGQVMMKSKTIAADSGLAHVVYSRLERQLYEFVYRSYKGLLNVPS